MTAKQTLFIVDRIQQMIKVQEEQIQRMNEDKQNKQTQQEEKFQMIQQRRIELAQKRQEEVNSLLTFLANLSDWKTTTIASFL